MSDSGTNNYTVEHYLEYVRVLYGRIAAKEKDSGFTQWALLGLVAYVVTKAIPLIDDFRSEHNLWAVYYVLVSCGLIIVNCSRLIVNEIFAKSSLSTYDYRQRSNKSKGNNFYVTSILCIQQLPQLIFCYLAWRFGSLNDLEYRFFSLNSFIGGFALLAGLGMMIHVTIYSKKQGHMPPATFDNGYAVWLAVFLFISRIAFIGFSLFVLWKYSLMFSGKLFESLVMLSLYTVVLIMAFMVLLESIPKGKILLSLARLERDIVVHDLSVNEVKDRLESEILGWQVGEWLEKLVAEIKAESESLVVCCNHVNEELLKLNELDSSLVYERVGRLKDLSSRIRIPVEALEKKLNPVVNWVNGLKTKAGHDEYTRELIKDTVSNLENVVGSAKAHALASLKKIESDVDSLK